MMSSIRFAETIIANADSGVGTQWAGTDIVNLARAYLDREKDALNMEAENRQAQSLPGGLERDDLKNAALWLEWVNMVADDIGSDPIPDNLADVTQICRQLLEAAKAKSEKRDVMEINADRIRQIVREEISAHETRYTHQIADAAITGAEFAAGAITENKIAVVVSSTGECRSTLLGNLDVSAAGYWPPLSK